MLRCFRSGPEAALRSAQWRTRLIYFGWKVKRSASEVLPVGYCGGQNKTDGMQRIRPQWNRGVKLFAGSTSQGWHFETLTLLQIFLGHRYNEEFNSTFLLIGRLGWIWYNPSLPLCIPTSSVSDFLNKTLTYFERGSNLSFIPMLDMARAGWEQAFLIWLDEYENMQISGRATEQG